ncbi:MAG TPA: polysaccharide deacetylase family protein [Trebonia sp.]|jgi:peptidoglycan/xylan/chitin deacetylase (PgdA/CDA1 family)
MSILPESSRLPVIGAAAVAAAAAAGTSYWLGMSSYSQAFGYFPYRGATSEKKIALTFDDGPNEPYTSQLANLLRDRGVRATFFQVGRAVLEYPEVTARLASDGHLIGNHGFTHEFPTYLSRRTLVPDVRKGMEALATVGIRPALYRPPWLMRIPSLNAVLKDEGLQAISGEFCHALEVFQPSAELIAKGVLAKACPGSIIIFHDGWDGKGANRASTVAAARIVVDQLAEEGYSFVTVDEMLGLPAYQ